MKSIVAFVAGALPAAAITYALVISVVLAGISSSLPVGRSKATPAFPFDDANSEGSSVAGEMLRDSADDDDFNVLEAQLATAAAQRYSIARETEIKALLHSLSKLDLGRALEVSETLELDSSLIADVVRKVAEGDIERGLSTLSMVRISETRLKIGLALHSLIEDPTQGIDQIVPILPETLRAEFRSEALAQRAERDPIGALRAVAAIQDGDVRIAAIRRIGRELVRHDPVYALSSADSLPLELRDEYRSSVTLEWARVDVVGFLAYADSQLRLDDLSAAMVHAMGVDPSLAYDVASRHPPVPLGRGLTGHVTLERAAFGSMVSQDPKRTLAILDAMPGGSRKQYLLRAFAETYGRLQPQEALAWARSVAPPDPVLIASVIAFSAATDLDQALKWFSEYRAPPQFMADTIGRLAASDPRRTEIADGLLAQKGNANVAELLTRMTEAWTLVDPAGVMDWVVSSNAARDAPLVANVARVFSERDARAAAGYAHLLPAETRSIWVREVVARIGGQDPQSAATWIAQLQGESGYEAMLNQVVQQSAMVDPAIAAQMALSAPAEVQETLVSSVASAWSALDLKGAAEWATTLRDRAAQTAATVQIAKSWAQRDPQQAQRWAADLPSGPFRDDALSAILEQLVRDDVTMMIDWALLAKFDSDAIRDRTVSSLIGRLAIVDPERSKVLLDEWLTDPSLQQRVGAALKAIEEGSR